MKPAGRILGMQVLRFRPGLAPVTGTADKTLAVQPTAVVDRVVRVFRVGQAKADGYGPQCSVPGSPRDGREVAESGVLFFAADQRGRLAPCLAVIVGAKNPAATVPARFGLPSAHRMEQFTAPRLTVCP